MAPQNRLDDRKRVGVGRVDEKLLDSPLGVGSPRQFKERKFLPQEVSDSLPNAVLGRVPNPTVHSGYRPLRYRLAPKVNELDSERPRAW